MIMLILTVPISYQSMNLSENYCFQSVLLNITNEDVLHFDWCCDIPVTNIKVTLQCEHYTTQALETKTNTNY